MTTFGIPSKNSHPYNKSVLLDQKTTTVYLVKLGKTNINIS